MSIIFYSVTFKPTGEAQKVEDSYCQITSVKRNVFFITQVWRVKGEGGERLAVIICVPIKGVNRFSCVKSLSISSKRH